ncbi:mitogen-activated protein kinase organizer [Thraustotheca clavata]|uniref:Mitogen-activated protein kinase organizer n=1 Tax=Thraustotheca clavata TaxID=74557 RepID=A0A1V9YWK9_9STRA|nr:mitogen-activated protein kinase organizer [Thraustotheca clavata]
MYECARVLRGHVGTVNAVRFNDKGTYCMSCGNDRTIRLWNPHREGLDGPDTAFLVKSYTGLHGYDVRDVAIENDNAKFASCGRDKVIFQWDVATGKNIRKLEGHAHSVNAVEYNDDCSVLASASYDSTVRLWDMRSRNSFNPIQILNQFTDSVTSVKLTDHEIIAGSVDGYVRIYDVRAGLLTQDNLHSPVVSINLSSDLNQIVAATMAKKVYLFEKATGTELNYFEGHQMDSYGIECGFTYDDSCVFSGSEDGRVVIWDMVYNTSTTKSFKAHDKPVRSVVSHPTQDMLLTASVDTVKVWTTA